MSQWIADSDRLPDDEQTVLVAMVGESEPVWLGYHEGDQWWSVDHVCINVTHWMPLPPAPEVRDGD